MVDKIIRIGIDSSLAERGAERVKNALKGVQREAAQTSGAEIDITADTSGITAGIAEVRSALASISGASAEIPIGFDTSAIDREMAGIVNRIRDEVDRNVGNGVSVEASLDIATEAAAAEVGRMLAALPDDIRIDVDLITDTVIAELQRVFAEAERLGGVSVPVRMDTAGAEAELRETFQRTPDPIDIPVQMDDAEAEADLRRILRQSRGSIELPVTADEAEAEREVREIIRRRRDGIELPVNANTDRANAAIDRLTGQTRSPVNVPISVDADQARTEIDSVFERSPDPVKIPVTVDAARANEEIDAFFRQTHDPIEVDIAVDAEQARAEIDGVSRLTPDAVEIPINVDTSRASAELGRLRDELGKVFPRGGGSAKISVEADVEDVVKGAKRAADAIDGISDAADDIPKKADKAADSLNAVQAAAARAAAAADNMSDAFRGATREMEAMELIGEALLAISTSIIEAITSFEDFEDAVQAATGTVAAAEMAMAMLEEFAHDTAISLEDATAAFVELRTNGLEASRTAMESYGNVAAGLNMTMEELAEAVGEAASGNFNKLNETQLKAKESGDKVIFTYHGVTTEVKNTSSAIAAFIKQMGNTEFAGSLQSQAEGVTGAFEAMSEAWNELSRDMGEGGLSQGLDNFATSMVRASEAADELGRILGGWLGNQATLLGRDIEGIVDQLNGLVDIFRSVTDAINSIPSLSGVFSGLPEFMKNAVPAIFDQPATPDTQQQGPPTDPAAAQKRAFGTDTDTPRKTKSRSAAPRKSEGQKQQESFDKQFAANDKMIRTLGVMDEAFERGRGAVVGMRNEIEDTTDRTNLLAQVGEKYTDIIMDQKAEMKGLKESIAFKTELMDQQEAIDQTVALAEAHKDGSVAVMQAQAANEAYNAAIRLGVVDTPEAVQQLTDLALAAETASRFLALETDLAGMDQQIESAARMATAYREGGAAIREATLEEQVRAAAVQAGLEWDEASVQKIRDRMTALRELQEIQREDEQAFDFAVNVEEMEGELRLSQMVGEARFVEAERIQMLADKKRELKDMTVTLTDAEEQQAATIGRLNAQMAQQSSELQRLATSIPNMSVAFDQAATGALLSFEDALVDIITGAKSAREAFADMAKSIAADLARMAIRMAIIQPLAMMFGGGFGMAGGMAGGAIVAHTGGVIGADPLPVRTIPKFHTGGIVGDAPMMSSPYAGFPKFHTGGLTSKETPAILEKGEGVFTKEQMAAMQPVNNNDNSSRGVTVVNNINVTSPPGGDRGAAESQANNIAKMVSMAVDERLVQASRPGGILNANGGY